MRSQCRIRISSCGICRGDHKLETFRISCGRTVASIHVATAYPFRAGSNADLVSGTVIADDRADGVGAMPVVIARRRRVVTARTEVRRSNIRVNGVVPVVIMIAYRAVPAPVLEFNGICLLYTSPSPRD